MRLRSSLLLTLAVLTLLTSVSVWTQLGTFTTQPVGNNATLARLYDAERHVTDSLSRVSTMTETDEQAHRREDSLRHVRVDSLLQEGAVQTAEDYYRAAYIFYHSARPVHQQRAHALAEHAVARNPQHDKAQRMVARAWDRFMRRMDRPQWYGTELVRQDDGTWGLYRIDTSQISEQDRQALGIPTLEERRQYIARMNARGQ
jgi:hypothetical protein